MSRRNCLGWVIPSYTHHLGEVKTLNACVNLQVKVLLGAKLFKICLLGALLPCLPTVTYLECHLKNEAAHILSTLLKNATFEMSDLNRISLINQFISCNEPKYMKVGKDLKYEVTL